MFNVVGKCLPIILGLENVGNGRLGVFARSLACIEALKIRLLSTCFRAFRRSSVEYYTVLQHYIYIIGSIPTQYHTHYSSTSHRSHRITEWLSGHQSKRSGLRKKIPSWGVSRVSFARRSIRLMRASRTGQLMRPLWIPGTQKLAAAA